MLCPCCSGSDYFNCCEPYHIEQKLPQTAEALMRSRYSAYAIPDGEYLMETTHPSKRHLHDENEMQEWGKSNQWTALEIISAEVNKVEFKAYFTDRSGMHHVHHELSIFKQIHKRWYYFSGRHL